MQGRHAQAPRAICWVRRSMKILLLRCLIGFSIPDFLDFNYTFPSLLSLSLKSMQFNLSPLPHYKKTHALFIPKIGSFFFSLFYFVLKFFLFIIYSRSGVFMLFTPVLFPPFLFQKIRIYFLQGLWNCAMRSHFRSFDFFPSFFVDFFPLTDN